jgi:predicted aspartyl protease
MQNISHRMLCGCALSFLVLLAPQARAVECKPLTLKMSLDFAESGGRILVPVAIEGTTVQMLVDTGSPLSAIDRTTAESLHLKTVRIEGDLFYSASGKGFQQIATVRSLSIGRGTAENTRLAVFPDAVSQDPRVKGILGADFLRNYDVEMDFAARKLNLLSPEHCEGKVVYWPASAIAVVPMHVVKSGHLVLSVTLDGKPLNALLDTSATDTFLTAEAAESLFGLRPASPGMTRVSDYGRGSTLYRHTFKALDLGGVAIGNIPVIVRSDAANDLDENAGGADLLIGMHELHGLHIYLAYGEGRMYATPAAPEAPGAHS